MIIVDDVGSRHGESTRSKLEIVVYQDQPNSSRDIEVEEALSSNIDGYEREDLLIEEMSMQTVPWVVLENRDISFL